MLHLLRRGEPVIGVKRPGSDLKAVEAVFYFYEPTDAVLYPQIVWKDLDLNDTEAIAEVMEESDTVYHCAGLISFEEKDFPLMVKSNVEATTNMVNVALAKKINAFCFVSSIATLQNPDHTGEMTEDLFWKKTKYQSSYAESKYLAEQEVWRAAEEGLNAVIVNPGIVIGPGFWKRGSGLLFSHASKGNRFYTEGITGYVGVDDVAVRMIELVKLKKFHERFILVENNYSFREILEMLSRGFNKAEPKVKADKFALQFLRCISFLLPKHKKISKAGLHSLLGKNYYSNQKIKSAVPLQFAPLNDCILATCRHYRA